MLTGMMTMHIRSIRHAVPSWKVSNDECRRIVRERLRERLNEQECMEVDRRIAAFLAACGTETRRLRRSGEKPVDFLLQASRDALRQADVAADDVDFVIYTGVGRGWVEPSMAALVQRELKLRRATGFDLLDACASWMRGIHVAHQFLHRGVYRTGLIVNCECGLEDYLDLQVDSPEAVDHRLASFTIGEAATATVVTADRPDDDFHFEFYSSPDDVDLCMIPLQGAHGFLPDGLPNDAQSGRFYSRSRELMGRGAKLAIECFRSSAHMSSYPYGIILTHAASEKATELVLRRLGLSLECYFGTHREYGNTVSASLPLAMSLALDCGRLRRGTRTMLMVASAGITIAYATFTY